MSEELAAALARVEAAEAATKEDYVELAAPDVAALTNLPAVRATPNGRALADLAAAAARKEGKTISLHRVKHLAPLLKLHRN